ncbi:hypothetical protein AMTR_s00014p00060170 [Amborella trichopoda]|uniref:Uncharacterized protein n=1 Tax=Amborella trichopoda TaxID=13333 RepID=W1PN01_AMBTC|nr:hypothetical protein AMTR_s00014p00060170 [Amborella trichopoda]
MGQQREILVVAGSGRWSKDGGYESRWREMRSGRMDQGVVVASGSRDFREGKQQSGWRIWLHKGQQQRWRIQQAGGSCRRWK